LAPRVANWPPKLHGIPFPALGSIRGYIIKPSACVSWRTSYHQVRNFGSYSPHWWGTVADHCGWVGTTLVRNRNHCGGEQWFLGKWWVGSPGRNLVFLSFVPGWFVPVSNDAPSTLVGPKANTGTIYAGGTQNQYGNHHRIGWNDGNFRTVIMPLHACGLQLNHKVRLVYTWFSVVKSLRLKC